MTIDDALAANILYERTTGDAYEVVSVDKRSGLIYLRKDSKVQSNVGSPQFVINEAGLSRYYLLPMSSMSNDFDIFDWMSGPASVQHNKEICRKCGTKGSINSVRDKIYYWCPKCKDEC